MKYLFKTQTTTNNDKFWIDSDIIKEKIINAENIKQAIKFYVESINKSGDIKLAESAIKNKRKMYRDFKEEKTKQVGYIFTGKTYCIDEYSYGLIPFYVSLLVEIFEINYPKF